MTFRCQFHQVTRNIFTDWRFTRHQSRRHNMKPHILLRFRKEGEWRKNPISSTTRLEDVCISHESKFCWLSQTSKVLSGSRFSIEFSRNFHLLNLEAVKRRQLSFQFSRVVCRFVIYFSACALQANRRASHLAPIRSFVRCFVKKAKLSVSSLNSDLFQGYFYQ